MYCKHTASIVNAVLIFRHIHSCHYFLHFMST